MGPLSAPGPFQRAGLVAVLVVAAWVLTGRPSPMPPVWPLGPQPTYSSVDAPALVAIEPVLHAPWLGARSRAIVWGLAGLIVLGGSGVATFAGATMLASSLVLMAVVLDVSFGAALDHGSGLVVAVGLVWLAAGAAFDDHSRVFARMRWFNPAAALVLWALAVWWAWIAVVAWPVVFAAFRRTPGRPWRGWWTIGSVLLGAAAFVGHFVWMTEVTRAITVSVPPVDWRDTLSVAFDARPRMPVGSFTAPELTTRLGFLLVTLAGVGLAFGALGRWWRRTALLSAALAVGVGLVWSEWQAEVLRFSLWALAPLAAVGLTWVASQSRRPAQVTMLLGAIAVIETVVRGARPLEGTDARGFRDELTAALQRRAEGAALVMVAEDTRIDSALVPWLSSNTQSVRRATQSGEAVAAARAQGLTVLAGPVGRRHLELAGVSFVDAFGIEQPAPYVMSEADGTFRCVPVRSDRWSQLPGLDYTGRLGLEIPAGILGELQVIVGDPLALPLRVESPDGREMTLRLDALSSGPGVAPPPADYWMDGGAPDVESRWIQRVRLPADPLRATPLALYLGRRAPRVIARLAGFGDGARARVCAAPLGDVHLRSPGTHRVSMDDEAPFGAGWYGREGRDAGAFRWADHEAVVLIRSAVRSDIEVVLDAMPAVAVVADVATAVSLRVNGVDIGRRAMAAGGARYTWRVPAGVWLAGTNELWWRTSHAVRPADTGGADTRSLALRVSGISVSRE